MACENAQHAVVVGARAALDRLGVRDRAGEPLLRSELEVVLPAALDVVSDRESLAAFVATLGAPGTALRRAGDDVARDLRADAGVTSDTWDAPRIATALGVALWTGSVAARVPRTIATLPLAVAESMAAVFAAGTRLVPGEGGAARLLSCAGDEVATIPVNAGVTFSDAQRWAASLDGLLAAKLVRHLPAALWAAYASKEPAWQELRFDGVGGLARALGENTPRNARRELLDVLHAGAALQRVWAPGMAPSGAWTFRVDGGGDTLVITPCEALVPFATRRMERGPGRRLVPWLPLPPFAGSRNGWAAQARLELLAVIELVRRIREVAEHGGAAIRWDRLAHVAGLAPTRVAPVLEAWTGPGGRFAKLQHGRWTLVEGAAQASLAQTAAGMAAASAAGKKAADHRWRRGARRSA